MIPAGLHGKNKSEVASWILREWIWHNQEKLSGRGLMVPITTFAPEPYEVRKAIMAVIEPRPDGFVAGFFDANIYASGDTEEDALRTLKGVLLDVFDTLSAESPARLGPEPKRQLAVLREFIATKPSGAQAE